MLVSEQKSTLWLLGLALTATCVALYASLDSILRFRDVQQCAMSYSRPSYIRVAQPESHLSSIYTLYLYREQLIDNTEELQNKPVLFIPGHAGSYKQVRSIAAEAAYYAQERARSGSSTTGLDFFTVDLQEDFSALSGQLLLDQAEYMLQAIEKILSMYRQRPTSVLIVGHSMGGVVGRLMLTLPSYQGNVNTVLTLATPHALPPVRLDPAMDRIYRTITRVWQTDQLANVTLVSVAGGTADSVVNSDSASLVGLVPSSQGFTIFATAMPYVWTGCDHKAILWCNQLVKRIAASLVDVTSQSHLTTEQRTRLFRTHLFGPGQATSLAVPVNIRDIDRVPLPSRLRANNKQQVSLIRFPDTDRTHLRFHLLSNHPIQATGRLTVLACRSTDMAQCIDVSNQATALPVSLAGQTHPGFRGSALAWIDVSAIPDEMDHIGVLVRPGPDIPHSFIQTGFLNDTERWHAPFWAFAWKGATWALSNQPYARIRVHSITSPLLAYRLQLTGNIASGLMAPMVRHSMDILGESKFHVGLSHQPIVLTFHGDPFKTSSSGMLLEIWGAHGMTLHLKVDWYASIGQWLLRYGLAVVPFMYVVVCWVVYQQAYWRVIHKKSVSFLSLAAAWLRQPWVIGGLLCVGVLSVVCPHSELLLGDIGPYFWWLPGLLIILSVALAVVLDGLVSILLWLGPHRPWLFIVRRVSGWPILGVTGLVALVALGVPLTIQMLLLYVILLCKASACRTQAIHQKTPSAIASYIHVRSALMLFTVLLPYSTPAAVARIHQYVMVRNWTAVPLLGAQLEDASLFLGAVVILVLGWQLPDAEKSQYWLRAIRPVVFIHLLYMLFLGFKQPYPLHTLAYSLLHFL